MSNPRDIVGLVESVPLFDGIPSAELADIARAARVRRFARGQIIFTSGDPGDALLFVIKGRVKLSVGSADGGELALTTVTKGGLIGELGVVDGGPRSADAQALDSTELLVLHRDLIQDVMTKHPAVARHLLESTAASLRRLTDTTADLVFLDLPRRVAKLLIEAGGTRAHGESLGLSQEELAHRVGGTRQSVNAALRGFERRGWIELAYRSVIVRQAADLARFAGEPSD